MHPKTPFKVRRETPQGFIEIKPQPYRGPKRVKKDLDLGVVRHKKGRKKGQPMAWARIGGVINFRKKGQSELFRGKDKLFHYADPVLERLDPAILIEDLRGFSRYKQFREIPRLVKALAAQGFSPNNEDWPKEFDRLIAIIAPLFEWTMVTEGLGGALRGRTASTLWGRLASGVWRQAAHARESLLGSQDYWAKCMVKFVAALKNVHLKGADRNSGDPRRLGDWVLHDRLLSKRINWLTRHHGIVRSRRSSVFAAVDLVYRYWYFSRLKPLTPAKREAFKEGENINLQEFEEHFLFPALRAALKKVPIGVDRPADDIPVKWGRELLPVFRKLIRASPSRRRKWQREFLKDMRRSTFLRFCAVLNHELRDRVNGWRAQREATPIYVDDSMAERGVEESISAIGLPVRRLPREQRRLLLRRAPLCGRTYLKFCAIAESLPDHLGDRRRCREAYRRLVQSLGLSSVGVARKRIWTARRIIKGMN